MSTILITGASSGFGEACAKIYVAAGHKVVLLARRLARLESLRHSLSEIAIDSACCVQLDVRDRDAVSKLFDVIPEAYRDVDVLINSAGLALGLSGAQEADLDDWDAMVDTNIKGMMYMCRAVLPGMISRGGGHVINLGSVAASWPYPGGNAYGGSKAFVQQFSRNLRVDLHGKQVRVSVIEPGMCETEFSLVRFEGDEAKAKAVYEGMQPLSAKDVAETIFWTTSLPKHINVNQLELMPTAQSWSPFAVHREE